MEVQTLINEKKCFVESQFAHRIRTLRMAAGYTQASLAERLGVTPQAVSKWENAINCPDIFLLPMLSALLCVSIDELFE